MLKIVLNTPECGNQKNTADASHVSTFPDINWRRDIFLWWVGVWHLCSQTDCAFAGPISRGIFQTKFGYTGDNNDNLTILKIDLSSSRKFLTLVKKFEATEQENLYNFQVSLNYIKLATLPICREDQKKFGKNIAHSRDRTQDLS